MSKGRYNYYDPEYNPQVTDGNELLLMVNNVSFSFVVIQTAGKKVLVWGENYPLSELQNPDDLKHILTTAYHDTKAVVYSDSFTVIPKELYNENDMAGYSKFITADQQDAILVNEFDANNYVIFKVNEAIINSLKKHIDLKSVFFTGKVFASTVNFTRPDKPNLYAHIEERQLQLLYLKDGLLRFYNSFEFSNPDELMYFIVLTANELNLNLDETSLILSGEVNVSDKKIQRVSEFLSKVYLNQTQIVVLPQGFLPHQILLLSGLTLCESLVEN